LSSPETQIDPRFDEIVEQLRAELPAAPAATRTLVLARLEDAPAPRRRANPRRLIALAVPVVAAASAAIAIGVGLVGALTESPRGAAAPAAVGPVPPEERARAAEERAPYSSTTRAKTLQPASRAERRAVQPGPTRGRAQNFSATLHILVGGTTDLSTATQRALRATRRLGGYVVSVDYRTPSADEGAAALRVRIPISRVQAGIVSFSGLGRILAQQTQIADVQRGLDELSRQIRRLERRLAQLRRADPQSAEIPALERRISQLRRQRTEVNRRAAFATVALDLTTQEPREEPAAPGRFDRAVDDALGVLSAELAIGAYALIVAAPFLLLAGAGILGARAYRRVADQRLLERA